MRQKTGPKPVPFEERYIPEPMSGCWLWIATVVESGYGRMIRDGKEIKAHRFSWERVNGPVPAGMCLLHKCDVPACVNPDHLMLGTPADNRADCVRKGRQARGSKQHLSKLNTEQVLEIRRRYALGGVTIVALGREFGVAHTGVSSIIRRKIWRHV